MAGGFRNRSAGRLEPVDRDTVYKVLSDLQWHDRSEIAAIENWESGVKRLCKRGYVLQVEDGSISLESCTPGDVRQVKKRIPKAISDFIASAPDEGDLQSEGDDPITEVNSAPQEAVIENVKRSGNEIVIAKSLKLPKKYVTQAAAIVAIRGAGKTHTAHCVAEEFCRLGLPFVAIDPTGAWWGLRALYPVMIFGGRKADRKFKDPISDARFIADFILENPGQYLIDMSEYPPPVQHECFSVFAERIYHQCDRPVHIFVDEADEFAPQHASTKEDRRSLAALDRLVRRGRIKGIGCTMITQRTAVINKNVLSQVEILVAMRTLSPLDCAAIEAWMINHLPPSFVDSVIESIGTLRTGEAWFLSPSWLGKSLKINVRQKESFDSGQTPDLDTVAKDPSLVSIKSSKIDVMEGYFAESLDDLEKKDKIAKLLSELEDLGFDTKNQ